MDTADQHTRDSRDRDRPEEPELGGDVLPHHLMEQGSFLGIELSRRSTRNCGPSIEQKPHSRPSLPTQVWQEPQLQMLWRCCRRLNRWLTAPCDPEGPGRAGLLTGAGAGFLALVWRWLFGLHAVGLLVRPQSSSPIELPRGLQWRTLAVPYHPAARLTSWMAHPGFYCRELGRELGVRPEARRQQ